MKVKLYGDTFRFRFLHRRGNPYTPDGTECSIERIIQSEKEPIYSPIGHGETKLHPSDNYNKNEGRKRSLARALKDGEFDREERTKFWQEYFKVRGKIN